MKTPIFPARVSERGRLEFAEVDRRGLDMWLASLAGKHVLATFREDRASLSERQRRWYFGQVLGRIHKHTGQDVEEELHPYFKDKFLGTPENRLIVLVDAQGEVVDERDVTREQTITVLNTKEMAHYCEQIREMAALKLAIDIPNPDPEWRTAQRAA